MGMYVLISGHMDFWTHNKLISLCSAYPNDLLYVYVNLNQWTHGLVDTQQNNVNLQCTQMNFLKKLFGYICFKSVDTWTFGHTAKQYILVQCWIFLKKLYSYVN